MTRKLHKFPVVDKAVMELMRQYYPNERMGGDLAYDGPLPYMWISAVAGAGKTSALEGLWYVDIDIFHTNFLAATDFAYDIEANLLGPGARRTSKVIFDQVEQSSPPTEIPWRDDAYFRISTTYSFLARRIAPIS